MNESFKRVLIIKGDSNGCFPVPATKGGAVQTLIEELVCQNEKYKSINMELVSFFEKEAKEKAESIYPNTVFHWVHPSRLIHLFDKFSYWFFRNILHKSNRGSYKSIFSALYFIIKSAKLLRKEKYDAVILENYIPLIWIIRKSKYRGKFYFHLHNVPRTNAKSKKFLQKCDGFICVSEFVANEISKPSNPIGPISKEKLYVVLNGIDTESFKRINNKQLISRQRDEYGIKDNEKVILFAGRLCKEKGVGVFLQALKGIDLSNCKVLIVGGTNFTIAEKDDFYNSIKKLSEEYGDKVVFTGYVEHKKMPLIYNVSDIVVLPSVAVEACPLAVGEALSCHCCVITTNMGGIPEIADGVAVLFENDKCLVNNIHNSIAYFINQENYEHVEQSAYENYRINHSLDRYYSNFVDIILKISSEKQ